METIIMGDIGIIGYNWGPMMNKPPPFEGLNINIPIITPIKGRGLFKSGVWVRGI